MYVRNYGLPRGSIKHEGEPSLTKATPVENEAAPIYTNSNQNTGVTPTTKEAPVIQDEAQQATAASDSESQAPMQRQRLKGRILKKRIREELPQLLECEESTSPSKSSAKEEEISCQAGSDAAAHQRGCKGDQEPRFSAEELFLGGMLLLLMGDRADDDILIILTFLLFSGFKLKG